MAIHSTGCRVPGCSVGVQGFRASGFQGSGFLAFRVLGPGVSGLRVMDVGQQGAFGVKETTTFVFWRGASLPLMG